MAEPSKLAISVSYDNENASRPRVGRVLTLDLLAEWIRQQHLDEFTTKGLITLASRYPSQALPAFRKNFNLMLQRVRNQRKQSSGEEV